MSYNLEQHGPTDSEVLAANLAGVEFGLDVQMTGLAAPKRQPRAIAVVRKMTSERSLATVDGMTDETRIALKNLLWLQENRDGVEIDWNTDTLSYGDGGGVLDLLTEPGFTPATAMKA